MLARCDLEKHLTGKKREYCEKTKSYPREVEFLQSIKDEK